MTREFRRAAEGLHKDVKELLKLHQIGSRLQASELRSKVREQFSLQARAKDSLVYNRGTGQRKRIHCCTQTSVLRKSGHIPVLDVCLFKKGRTKTNGTPRQCRTVD